MSSKRRAQTRPHEDTPCIHCSKHNMVSRHPKTATRVLLWCQVYTPYPPNPSTSSSPSKNGPGRPQLLQLMPHQLSAPHEHPATPRNRCPRVTRTVGVLVPFGRKNGFMPKTTQQQQGFQRKGVPGTARHNPTTRLLVEGMVTRKLPQLVLGVVIHQADCTRIVFHAVHLGVLHCST